MNNLTKAAIRFERDVIAFSEEGKRVLDIDETVAATEIGARLMVTIKRLFDMFAEGITTEDLDEEQEDRVTAALEKLNLAMETWDSSAAKMARH